jgi:FkbH-like protein
MNLLIRSTSFLLNDNLAWGKISNNKISFSEYNDLFSNFKNKRFDYEILLIFSKDLVDQFSLNQSLQKKKINKVIDAIESKSKLNKNTKYLIFFSSYYFNNISENLKSNLNSDYKRNFSDKIYKVIKNNNNIFYIDIDKFFSEKGFENCFDTRNLYHLRCPLSLSGLEIFISTIQKTIQNTTLPRKKVLLLDCDNTLWGDVLGEVGINNIILGQDGLGQAFKDFQKAILKIKNLGIILVLLSKNNENDVKDVLKKHQDMILKIKDIAKFKVNWKSKSLNISELSKELYLNPDSFVFWDDNPIEREIVKKNHKSIDVITPDKNVENWPKQILEYNHFYKNKITKEDKDKTKQYQKRAIFLEEKNNFLNEQNYLKSINLKPKIIKLDSSNISRAEQMCQKVNQFNFTTRRYDLYQLKNLDYCRLIDLKDTYGDHGRVGMFGLKILKDFIFVDLFLLSCRILGRYLENWMYSEIKKIQKKLKKKRVIFEYVPTKKNIVTNEFIKKIKLKKIIFKEMSKLNNDKVLKLNKSSCYYEINNSYDNKIIEIYENR